MRYLINIEQPTTPFGGSDSPSSTPSLIPYTLSDTNALRKNCDTCIELKHKELLLITTLVLSVA